MDNVCHTLVGAALGEAGLKRHTRYGSATLMIASNLPDLDALVLFTDTSAIAFRRGWTHGVAAQLLLPIALTAIMWTAGRQTPRGGVRREGVHAGWLLLLSYAGVCSHVFLDYLNNYGIRLLAPFDWRWIYGDAVFIIDPWLWLMFGAGIWLARRQAIPRPARASLVFAACYIAVMLLSARAARLVVADVWRELRGAEPRALMVGPSPLTPFTRDVIIDAGDRYETGTFSWWPTGVRFDTESVPKNHTHPAVALAREQSRAIRDFLVWARFPFWIVEPTSQGTRVVVADMRFPEATQVSAARFAASAVLRP